MEGIDQREVSQADAEPLLLAQVTPLPRSVAIGGGTALFIDGSCSHPRGELRRLDVAFAGTSAPAMGWGMPLPERVEGDSYWWTIVALHPIERPELAWVELRATLRDGREATGRLAAIELLPTLAPPDLGGVPRPAEPDRPAATPSWQVAVCMATHEPPLELFERQIESIREQSHRDWICLISDDDSSPAKLAAIRAVLGDDPRFSLSPSTDRLGFYRNFERALAMVPATADFVALSDQDDRWHPDKLARLLAAIRPDSRLVYSDMRIVDEAGDVIADTYWGFRRNNHTEFSALLLGNTVTGAASLLRRSLLDDVLPFPPPVGNAFHDHWIAEVAMALGEIDYVDEPLYDYVQHGGAAIGHRGANNARVDAGPLRRLAKRIEQRDLRPGWRGYYFSIACRTAVNAEALRLRCGPRMPAHRRRDLERVRPTAANVPRLLARAVGGLSGSSPTLGRERAMLRGLAWRGLSEVRRRARRTSRPSPAAGPAAGTNASSDPALTPILVDYFTRDGSTLMMRLLASSPQIVVEDVYPFERKYFAYLWRWAQLLDRERWDPEGWGPRSLGSLDDAGTATLIGPPPWIPRPLIDPVEGEAPLGSRAFELVWGEFSRRAAERARAEAPASADPPRYLAEKHLNTWLVAAEQIPPHELIVMLRDPRDSWVSMSSFADGEGFGGEDAGSEERMLAHVIGRQRQRLRWIAGLLEKGDVPMVRYEDLVGDLAGVAARLGARLGVQLDAAATEADTRTRRRHVSAASAEASVGRWRDELEPRLAEVFAAELGSELATLGYDV